MVIRVTEDRFTLEATDPVLVQAGSEALAALGDQAEPPGSIRGDLPAAASLSIVWQALASSLADIQRRATSSAASPSAPPAPAGDPAA